VGEVLEAPDIGDLLDRAGIIVSGDRVDLAPHDAPQRRADGVRAFLELVARRALAKDLLALCDVRGGQQRRKIDLLGRVVGAAGRLFDLERVGELLGVLHVEDLLAGEVREQKDEQRGAAGAEELVELHRVHCEPTLCLLSVVVRQGGEYALPTRRGNPYKARPIVGARVSDASLGSLSCHIPPPLA